MTDPEPEHSENHPLKQDGEASFFTYDEALDKLGVGASQIFLLFVCGGGWLYDGIQLSYLSFILPTLNKEWQLTSLMGGALGAVLFLGMMFGAIIGGVVSDLAGRKIVFISFIFISSIAALAAAFSPNVWVLMVLRFFVGLGLGASVPTDFAMFLEYCPRHARGTLSAMMNIFWGAGFFVVVFLCWLIITNVPQWLGWRLVVGLLSVPGLLSLIPRFFIDESPRYNILNNRTEAALKTLHKIAYWNRAAVPHGELRHLEHPRAKESAGSMFIHQFTMLFSPQLANTSVMLFAIWFFLSYGSFGYSFTLPLLLSKVSATEIYSNAILVAIVGAIGYIFSSVIVDRFPRGKLLGAFFLITGVAMCFVGFSTQLSYVVSVSIVVSFLSATPWSLTYTYTPEVYPTIVRTTGMGVCSTMGRMGGALTPLVSGLMLSRSNVAPFVTHGLAFLISGVISFLLPIETVGRDLKDELSVPKDYPGTNFDNHRKESEQPLLSD